MKKLFAVLLLTPMAANAVPIDVGGTIYDLEPVTVVFADNVGLLTGQAWWGSESLADAIAVAIAEAGWPVVQSNHRAFAAFQYNPSNSSLVYSRSTFGGTTSTHLDTAVPVGQRLTYVIEANRVTEPGVLAMLGIGLGAFGLSRRRKRR